MSPFTQQGRGDRNGVFFTTGHRVAFRLFSPDFSTPVCTKRGFIIRIISVRKGATLRERDIEKDTRDGQDTGTTKHERKKRGTSRDSGDREEEKEEWEVGEKVGGSERRAEGKETICETAVQGQAIVTGLMAFESQPRVQLYYTRRMCIHLWCSDTLYTLVCARASPTPLPLPSVSSPPPIRVYPPLSAIRV